jgi:hypothetical protein
METQQQQQQQQLAASTSSSRSPWEGCMEGLAAAHRGIMACSLDGPKPLSAEGHCGTCDLLYLLACALQYRYLYYM